MKADLTRLTTAANAFLKEYQFMRSSDGACGRCLCGSRDFIRDFLPTARVLHLSGCRISFPRRNAYYHEWADPDANLYHAVIEYRGWVLDVSRRQFQPRCRMPFIEHIDEVRRRWLRVTFKDPMS